MQLSVIIVSWNTRELLRTCLQKLEPELAGISAEVFLIDNASADGSADMVESSFPTVKLTRNTDNLGFAKANNQALKLATGEKIFLLNPDTEVQPGSIKALMNFLDQHSKAGIVAPQLLNTDGSVQRSCRAFPTFSGMLFELVGLSRMFPNEPKFREYKMLDWAHDDERQVDQPEGAALMLRSEVVKEVGVLDEGYWMLFEEVDWCYRIKKTGWEIWFTPTSKVIHHYGQSIKQVKAKMILSSHRGLHRYWKKHLRANHSYLDLPAYMGLMALAYVRIFSYKLKGGTGPTA